MKKKVLLFAYTKVNLGDNLFIYMLLHKYPDVSFFIHSDDEKYKNIYSKFKNISFLDGERNLYKVKVNEFDAFLYVGGSIFMESEYGFHEMKEFNYFIKKCKKNNKKFYYMSCNYGPYYSDEYFKLSFKNFELCDDICFRDKASYELFSKISSVRYASDMVFSLKLSNRKKVEKTLGISLINLEIRDNLKEYTNNYNEFIRRSIVRFVKKKYKIFIFPFSDFEGDLIAANEILKKIPSRYHRNITIIGFDNIDSYLDVYCSMEYMICSRFHSMILSMLSGQKIYNVIYSDKQSNVINDNSLFNDYLRIEEINKKVKLKEKLFSIVDEKKLRKLILDSKHQVDGFDKFINE